MFGDDHVQISRGIAVKIVVVPQHAVADTIGFEQTKEAREKSFPDVPRRHFADLKRS